MNSEMRKKLEEMAAGHAVARTLDTDEDKLAHQFAMRDAYLSGAEAGFRMGLEAASEYCKHYREAYSEDFSPHGPSEEEQKIHGNLITRTSFRMGRFVLDNCVKDILALGED